MERVKKGVRKASREKIKVGENELEEIEEFAYLGSIITKKAKMESEISKRVAQAEIFYQQVRKLLWDEDFPIKCKLLLYKVYYLPILTYGAVTWSLGERDSSRIQAAEMKFVRSIAGVSKLDKIKSREIRKQVGVEKLLFKLGRERLRWYGHVKRMGKQRIPRAELEEETKAPEDLVDQERGGRTN